MVLQKDLRAWNEWSFGNIQKNIHEAMEDMPKIKERYDQQRGLDLQCKLSKARAKHARWLAIEKEFWK